MANGLINEFVLMDRTLLIPRVQRALSRLRGIGFVRIVHGIGMLLIIGYIIGASMEGWADVNYLIGPTLIEVAIAVVTGAVAMAAWRLLNEGLALMIGAVLGEKSKPDLSPEAFRI